MIQLVVTSIQHSPLSILDSSLSRHVMASIFGLNVFPDLVCAVHKETSRQFVASVFGMPLAVGILGNLVSPLV